MAAGRVGRPCPGGAVVVATEFRRRRRRVLIGMQDVIAEDFPKFGAVTTYSWLAPQTRGRIGREMRSAILHLAFDGFGAREATSEAFLDNQASNAISRSLGYEENGLTWATRRGHPFQFGLDGRRTV